MPAAAVIPAPKAYTKVVAIKKLVVGSQERARGPPRRRSHCVGRGSRLCFPFGGVGSVWVSVFSPVLTFPVEQACGVLR